MFTVLRFEWEREGPQVDSSLYIGRKKNSDQSIKPIQDSGFDPAGSGRRGQMSSSTALPIWNVVPQRFYITLWNIFMKNSVLQYWCALIFISYNLPIYLDLRMVGWASIGLNTLDYATNRSIRQTLIIYKRSKDSTNDTNLHTWTRGYMNNFVHWWILVFTGIIDVQKYIYF